MIRRVLLSTLATAALIACGGTTAATHHASSSGSSGSSSTTGHLAGSTTGTTGHLSTSGGTTTSSTSGTGTTSGLTTGTSSTTSSTTATSTTSSTSTTGTTVTTTATTSSTTTGTTTGTTTSSTTGTTTSTSTTGTTSSTTSGTTTTGTTNSTTTTGTTTGTTTSGTTTTGTTSSSTTSSSTTTTGTTTAGATQAPGQSCSSDADCVGGGCIQGELPDAGPSGWTGGYCAPSCTGSATVCGGAPCVDYGTFSDCQGACSGPGTGQSGCRSGYACFYYDYADAGLSTSTDGICAPTCGAAGSGCYYGSTCDAQGNYCNAWPLDAGEAGTPCTGDADCGPSTAGFCLTGTNWTAGYCTAICTGDFGTSPFCGGGNCAYYGSTGICEAPCSTPDTGRSTCRAGYTCFGAFNASGGEDKSVGVCEPDCTVTGCNDPNGVYIYCHTDDGYCYNG